MVTRHLCEPVLHGRHLLQPSTSQSLFCGCRQGSSEGRNLHKPRHHREVGFDWSPRFWHQSPGGSHTLPLLLGAHEPRHLCHPVLLVFENQLHCSVRGLHTVTLPCVKIGHIESASLSCMCVFPRVASPFLRSKASVETNTTEPIAGVRLTVFCSARFDSPCILSRSLV